jgi:hypothetical protein
MPGTSDKEQVEKEIEDLAGEHVAHRMEQVALKRG